MPKRNPETITIGSGDVYAVEYNAETGIPETDTICVAGNRLGHSQGGAALTYTAEVHEEKDDLGRVSKIVVMTEEALLKLGLITWNGSTLAKLADRCKVTEASGKRTIMLGGAGNAQGKEWVVCFHHIDKKDGDIWVLIRGTNTAGLALTFAPDAGTKLEPEFKAMPQDDEGTLVQIIEEIDAA